jgi:hypothetical protein
MIDISLMILYGEDHYAPTVAMAGRLIYAIRCVGYSRLLEMMPGVFYSRLTLFKGGAISYQYGHGSTHNGLIRRKQTPIKQIFA